MKKNLFCLLLAAVLLASCCPAAQAAYTNMAYSDELVEFIKAGEGFMPMVYSDGTGWYIGYGCAVNPAEYPNGITEEGAETLLRSKMEQYAVYVDRFLRMYNIGVTQGQYDAMMAMSYAFGPNWLNPANRLPSYLIGGIENYTDQEIACAFAAWCHVGGKPNTVALQRRIMEAKMFLYGDYTFIQYGQPAGWNWLILDANGGENDFSDVAVYKTGEAYGTLPGATRYGWYFAGWEKADGSLLQPTDLVSGNLDLKARWSTTPVTAPAEETPPAQEEAPAEETPPPQETPAPTEPPVPAELPPSVFPDVPVTEWYASYVAALAGAGVVNGYEDGTFRPQNNVSWGEALKLVLLSSGFSEQDPEKAEEGGPTPHWASGYLAFAEKKQYLAQGAVTALNEPISRDALADLCAAALELSALPAENPYSDSARTSVLQLYAAGIMEGSFDESGKRVFKGDQNLTRAEICAVLTRVRSYVDKTWILYAGYRIPINYDLRFNPYDASSFYTENGRTKYSDGVRQVRYGIDVSSYQGSIDWAKVAADGIDFAIIRCGYRGYSTGTLGEDTYFESNIRGALENGIEVGVYFFSQALNVGEALEELEYTLELIKDWKVTLPVVYDWEQMTLSNSRTKSPDWAAVTECIVAFCEGAAAAGYTPMTYYNPSMAYLRLDLSRLQKYPTWLAHYVDVTNFRYDFQMWQYGSSGTVDGIFDKHGNRANVDMDILFTELTY